MASRSSKDTSTGYPEFAVRRERFNQFFDPPLARSTFHDFVNKGKILPVKGIRGFYRLNESLSRMGLREVPSLPDVTRRTGEELVRLAFSLNDPDIFPAPAWLMRDDPLDAQDLDHALRIAERHRVNVEGLQTAVEKPAYLAGTLDSEELIAGLPGVSSK